MDTCERASLTGKFFRGLPPAVVDDIGATLGLAAARTVPRYVGPGGGEVRIIISAYRAPRSAMMSISVHRPLPRWGRRRTRALHWTRNSLASLPGRHEWHPLLARPWQLPRLDRGALQDQRVPKGLRRRQDRLLPRPLCPLFRPSHRAHPAALVALERQLDLELPEPPAHPGRLADRPGLAGLYRPSAPDPYCTLPEKAKCRR
jgi:hypothetical protein